MFILIFMTITFVVSSSMIGLACFMSWFGDFSWLSQAVIKFRGKTKIKPGPGDPIEDAFKNPFRFSNIYIIIYKYSYIYI